MPRTLVRTPSHNNSRPKRRMTPGSTRKNLDFDNSQRRSRSRRVSTLRKSPSFKQSDRRISLGSTRKTLRFSKSRTRNNKSRKRPKFGPPRRVLIKKSRKIKGSPRRVRRRIKTVRTPWKKYGGRTLKRKRRGGNHTGLFW